MNTYHYGSTATSNALGVSKAFRAFLNSTAKRGPRPGIETVAHNRWAMKRDPYSDDGDTGIRKAG